MPFLRYAERGPAASAANRALLAAAILVPLAFFFAVTWYLRADRLRTGDVDVRQTVMLLEEHARRVFEAQQLIIDRVDQYLGDMSWDEIRRSEDVHLFLKELAASSPHVDGLWLVPPDGRTANSADYFPFPDVDVSEREYFQALQAEDRLHFGEMIIGRIKGNQNFNLSRRRSPRETFEGLILVTASLDYFTEYWSNASPYRNHVAALLRPDGEILVRFPPAVGVPERVEPDSPLLAAMVEAETGVFTGTSSIDGERRIYGYSRIGDYPVFLGFGVAVDDVLAPWRREVLAQGLLALAAAALLGGTGLLALRQGRLLAGTMTSWRETAERLRAEVDRREIAEDIVEEKERLLERLGAATAERRAILESMMEGVVACDARGRVSFCNGAAGRILRLGEGAAPDLAALAREGRVLRRDGTTVGEHETPFARVLGGETLSHEELHIRPAAGGEIVCRFLGAPLRDGDGRIAGGVLTFEDVTEERASEERRALLMSELDHRVRNMLATIMAMVRISSRHAETKEALVETLVGRVGAMTRTHGLLTQSGWRGASLRQIVSDEVQPYSGEGRLSLDGKDDVVLTPKDAVDFALVVHELATNAAKHGAWSNDSGHVSVAWALKRDEQPHVHLVWRERGGPQVSPPERRGFGSTLLEASFEGREGAGTECRFEPDGLVCEIRMPFRPQFGAPVPAPPAGRHPRRIDDRTLAGLRVLVVEDEPLVQLELDAALSAAGATVIGPASRLRRAEALADTPAIDAALLDINLHGHNVSALAERLQQRRIPIVFVTGYRNLDLLSPSLRDLPRVQKPIDPAEVVRQLRAAVPGRTGAAVT